MNRNHRSGRHTGKYRGHPTAASLPSPGWFVLDLISQLRNIAESAPEQRLLVIRHGNEMVNDLSYPGRPGN